MVQLYNTLSPCHKLVLALLLITVIATSLVMSFATTVVDTLVFPSIWCPYWVFSVYKRPDPDQSHGIASLKMVPIGHLKR